MKNPNKPQFSLQEAKLTASIAKSKSNSSHKKERFKKT
jgi:hypothetical protein